MFRRLGVMLLLLLVSTPAMAHSRFFLSFGVPLYLGPPVAYAPPPVVYAPPPVYYAPPVAYQPAPRPYCRRFRGDAYVDGTADRFYGTACYESDGRWHIVP